jgi:hypothetical protein
LATCLFLQRLGIISPDELARTLSQMQAVVEDSEVVILPPRMSQVWARKTDR